MPRPTIVTTELETCTGHRLLNYVGKCANLHGHNYRWIVQVCASVPDRNKGYYLDFGDLKGLLRHELERFDHSVVLHHHDSAAPMLRVLSQTKLVLLNVNPTAENLAQWLADVLYKSLYDTIEWVNVELWETSKCRVSARGDEHQTVHILEEVL